MHARCAGVAHPRIEVGLDVELAQAVEGHDVEIVHGLVVLGRIARAHDDPALGNMVAPERLELQELQHRGVQRLGHAVDLVEEQDAAVMARTLHVVVHRGDDLAHGVFGHVEFLVAECAVHDEGQAERALPRVVRHGIRDEPDSQLLGHLRHDGRLPDTGRAEQEDGALRLHGDDVGARIVDGQVLVDGVLDLLFCFGDVHGRSSLGVQNE